MSSLGAFETRPVATWLSRLRVGLGASLALAPRTTSRLLFGADATSAQRVMTRVAGVRDGVLGAGSAIAIGQRGGGGDWMSMIAVVDLADAVVLLATRGLPARARVVALLAAGSGLVHLKLARELAAEEQPADEG